MAVEQTTIARPYAQALFAHARDHERLGEWSESLGFLAAIMREPEMTALTTNPKVGKDMLSTILREVASDYLDQEGLNLLQLLVDNGRLSLLPTIAQLFEQLKREAEGSVDVHLTSAYVIQPAEERMLAEALKVRFGKEVRITSEKDPDLIGGMCIRAGDLVIDGSIRGRLRQLANEFRI